MSVALLPEYLLAAALLAGAAFAKLRRPEPAAAVLRELGLPARGTFVRVASLVELGLAAVMIIRPAAGAPAAAALYFGFAALVLVQLRRGSTRSCGCLGSVDMPPTRAHAAANVALGIVCAVARPDPLRLFHDPLTAAVVWVAAAVAAWAVAVGLPLVPSALASFRRQGV